MRTSPIRTSSRKFKREKRTGSGRAWAPAYCLDEIYQARDAKCIHNPATGREDRLPHHVPAATGPPRKAVVVGAGPAGLEAARVLGLRGHRVVVLEASDAAGGQIRLASSSPRRRDLIGIIDWRLAECKHLDVDVRYNTYAEADDVLAEEPDLVVVATGGVPNTEFLTEGAQLVSDGWDVLSGAFRVKGDVLLFDDNGQHPGLDAAEVLARGWREDRIRHAGADFGSRRRRGQLPRVLQGVRRT